MSVIENRGKDLITSAVVMAIVLLINVIGSFWYFKVDLTEEKRFTLTQPTEEILESIEDIMYVRIYLEGKFPAGFKRLRSSAQEMFTEFRSINPLIEYDFIDPNNGSVEQIEKLKQEFKENEMAPINLRVMDDGEMTEKLIWPYAVFHFGSRTTVVNLLENDIPGTPDEQVLNNSISLLEYKFANALQKVKQDFRTPIVFTTGHGELDKNQTADLEKTLSTYHMTGRVNLDSVYRIPKEVKVLVVAKPLRRFSEKNKFLIDQYIMNGGKVLWLIDALNVSLDSLRSAPFYVPTEIDVNLKDQLFKYGARVEQNLVLDLECTKIPLTIGQSGGAPQLELFDWFYHLKVSPRSNHPIVKSLDRINMFFPSSVDTIRTKTAVKKEILLTSSEYTRFQLPSTRLNFEILRYDADPEKFNKAHMPLAVLLEGVFPSVFENRVSTEMVETLDEIGTGFKSVSEPTSMIVVADGDIANNPVHRDGRIGVLGYNIYERRKYANKDFLINAIEYLVDETGIIQSRARDVKLRLLDKVKIKEEKAKWQTINLLIPLAFLALFGLIYNRMRKRKYARQSIEA